MKLAQLSIASLVAGLTGLIVLTGASLYAYERIQTKQAEIADLLQLKQDVDDFSVAADHMMLFQGTPSLRRAVRARGRAVQDRLSALIPSHPAARNGVQYIDIMLEGLAETGHAAGSPAAQDGSGLGPLNLTLNQRAALSHMANHGIGLDTALDEVLRGRRQEIARQATWITSGFAAAAMLFAAFSVGGFAYLHRRIAGPVNGLTEAIRRVERGEADARAPETGRDELAELGAAFNRLRAQQEAADQQARAHQAEREERARLLAESQRMASIGSWELDLTTNLLRWSEQTYRIVGVDPRAFDHALESFYARVHPDDLPALKASEDAALRQGDTHDVTVRIVRPDGAIRYVHERAEASFDRTGQPIKLAGTIQDVTDSVTREQVLSQQRHLLEIAGHVARFGGWSVDLERQEIYWSEQVYAIHELPPGTKIDMDQGISFYAGEDQDRIAASFDACANEGTPFDEEFELVTARGNRKWVRAVAEPVQDQDGKIVRVEGAFQDITDRKRAREEVERLAKRLRTTLESITDAFFILDRQWRFTFVNSEAERLVERSGSELRGKNVWAEFPEAVGTRIESEYRHAMENGVTAAFEDYYAPLGRWFDIRAYPSQEGLAVYFRDVTVEHELREELEQSEQDLRRSHDRLAGALETRKALINALPAHIALIDADGFVRDVNQQWRHFGLENASTDPDLGIGQNYLAICDHATGDDAAEAGAAADGLRAVLSGQQETFSLEYPCHSPDRSRWFRLMANRLGREHGEDSVGEAVVMHVDVTERVLGEQEMRRAATEDRLTGCWSRNGFLARLEERLHRGRDHSASMVIVLDIAAQRDVNEAHGYDVGDAVIQLVARRLQDAVGSDGIVGRIGGDEFALYVPVARTGERGPKDLRSAVAAVFAQPFEVENIAIQVAARFGYTRLGKSRLDAATVIHEAELALFKARDEARQEWFQYTSALDAETQARIRLTRELREALERDEFQLHFQPQVDLHTGEVLSSEALVRWMHPERGLQAPGVFMPVAEQSQLIGPIGDWILRWACRSLKSWREAGLSVVRVSVNVSLVQFQLGDFPARVQQILTEENVSTDDLTLEITESVFEDASDDLKHQLQALHDLGLRLSLDDFGTGYSSLSYLQQYPFDEIKVDKGFVQRMLSDPYSEEIVKTVIGIAEAVGADAVAEGVETTGERDALIALGCRIGQGFHYSMPLMEEDYRWLLEHRKPLPLIADTQDTTETDA